ncbi:MAG: UDP-2,3-diacylglucosamine diphosphatase LpxI [Pseudomonadota bacterium]
MSSSPASAGKTQQDNTDQASNHKLVVLAGGGDLPSQVIRAAANSFNDVLAISIAGEASFTDLPGTVATERVEWGEVGRLMRMLDDFSATRLVIVGSISRRPDYRSLKLDWGALQLLPRILGAVTSGGDASLLDKVAGLFAERGFELVGAHDVAPELVAIDGQLAGPKVDATLWDDVDKAAEAAWTAGHLDMGQGAVSVNGRLIAMEGAEGTDGMLQRVAQMRAAGRFSSKGRSGALAKCTRPGQDLRLDMPAIGPRTIENAAQAHLSAVAIEAGHVLISEKETTFDLCASKGISVIGLPRARFIPEGCEDQRG